MPNSDLPNSDLPNVGGMRQLWLRCLTFLLILLPGWACLEWAMARTPNAHTIKRDGVQALADSVDTLILGSSETYYGISPHHLSGTAFNLACPSQSLYFDYELTQRLLPELPRLKRVIILANYMSLYSELYDHPESWRQYQFHQEWGIPLQRATDYLDLRAVSRVALYTPQTALKALSNGFHTSSATRVDDRGWYRVPDEDRWGLGVKEAQGRLAVHHGFMKQKYLEGNVAVLERLLGLLREHHVEAVLITTPVWGTYRAGMRQGMWLRARTIFEAFAQRPGVRYLNFQHEPRMTAEDFEDADHLNADGAAHFAAILDPALGPRVEANRAGGAPRESLLQGG